MAHAKGIFLRLRTSLFRRGAPCLSREDSSIHGTGRWNLRDRLKRLRPKPSLPVLGPPPASLSERRSDKRRLLSGPLLLLGTDSPTDHFGSRGTLPLFDPQGKYTPLSTRYYHRDLHRRRVLNGPHHWYSPSDSRPPPTDGDHDVPIVWIREGGLSAIHFQGRSIRRVSCYTLLSWFRLPWPQPRCRYRPTPFRNLGRPPFGPFPILSDEPASSILLTKTDPLRVSASKEDWSFRHHSSPGVVRSLRIVRGHFGPEGSDHSLYRHPTATLPTPAILRETSEGTSYQAIRWVFRH